MEIPITPSLHQPNVQKTLRMQTTIKQKEDEEEENKSAATMINSLQLQHKPPPRTTSGVHILKKRCLQEGNNAVASSSPDQRSYVFTLEKVHTFKTMPSTRPLLGTTN